MIQVRATRLWLWIDNEALWSNQTPNTSNWIDTLVPFRRSTEFTRLYTTEPDELRSRKKPNLIINRQFSIGSGRIDHRKYFHGMRQRVMSESGVATSPAPPVRSGRHKPKLAPQKEKNKKKTKKKKKRRTCSRPTIYSQPLSIDNGPQQLKRRPANVFVLRLRRLMTPPICFTTTPGPRHGPKYHFTICITYQVSSITPYSNPSS